MRVIYMGTPAFAIPPLEQLVENGYQVVGVYTPPDRPAGRGRRAQPSPVKEFALEHGLPVRQPATFRSPEVQADLALLKPDVIVVAAYGKLLPTPVLELPALGCLNIHPSLLPRHRGPSPVATACLRSSHTGHCLPESAAIASPGCRPAAAAAPPGWGTTIRRRRCWSFGTSSAPRAMSVARVASSCAETDTGPRITSCGSPDR